MFRIGRRLRFHGSDSTDDNADLLRLGRKPVIRRKYGTWTMFALACMVLNEWSAVIFTFQIGYENGGSAGLIYGFIIAWLGTLATFTSLAELASMAPVSAGQYYWSAMVWPRQWSKLLSYVTGWMTVLGWQAGVASTAFAAALLIQTFIQVVHPSYVSELWHTTLLYWAVILLALLANVFSGHPLIWVQTGGFIIYVCGFLAVMIPLVTISPHADAKTVFTTFQNEGGWETQGLSFMVGLVGVAFDFLGADCVYHMSEEVHNARVVVPWALIVALVVAGTVGLLTALGLMFCITDPQAVLTSTYEYPFATIFLQGTGSRAGSAVMTFVIVMLQCSAVVGTLSTASRMMWSFARDKAMPASRLLSRVSGRSSIPRNTILVTATVATLVGPISLGSQLAFNDLLSLSISAISSSYLLACLGLLWRRLFTTDIQPFDEHSIELVNIPRPGYKLMWGPWHVPGIWGILINIWACVYLIVIFFFSFWPTAKHVTASSMNYSVLLFGAAALLSVGYYLLRGKRTFEGPAVDTSVTVESHEVKS